MMDKNSRELTHYPISTGVPGVRAQPIKSADETRKIGSWIMIACCIPMVGGAGLLLWGKGADAGWAEQLGALAPIGICLGAHLVMHKIFGRTCHGQQTHKGQDQK